MNLILNHIIGVAVGIIVLHVILVVPAMLRERRSPAATLPWLLTMLLLPMIGVVFYYGLAKARFRYQYRAKMEADQQSEEALSMYVDQRLTNFDDEILHRLRPVQRGLIELGANANSTPSNGGGRAFSGNAVDVYFDGHSKFAALKDAIRAACSHIHMEYYIFRGDSIGMEIRDLLVERAKAGVEVRLLLDGVGSFNNFPSDFFDSLAKAGGHVAFFLPLRFSKVVERVNFRNHRKIAIIDGSVGFLGGMNIGDEYLGLDPNMGRWQDSHARIAGPAVAELQRIFLTDWLFATDETVAESRFFPEVPETGRELVQIVSSGPDCLWPTLEQLYFHGIVTASKQVLISTPYFVPDESTLMAMETAALRGLDVRLLLPHKSDVMFVTSAARAHYQRLLDAGVRIFEYGRGFIHAKIVQIDGLYSTLGSANIDVRSFNLNFEISAFIHSERVATAIARQFEKNVAASNEILREEWENRPLRVKLRESAVQLLAGIL